MRKAVSKPSLRKEVSEKMNRQSDGTNLDPGFLLPGFRLTSLFPLDLSSVNLEETRCMRRVR